MLTVIEKVIFLQHVDVFSEISTEQMAYLAAIVKEVSFPKTTVIYHEQDPPDAIYLVLEGPGRRQFTAGVVPWRWTISAVPWSESEPYGNHSFAVGSTALRST